MELLPTFFLEIGKTVLTFTRKSPSNSEKEVGGIALESGIMSQNHGVALNTHSTSTRCPWEHGHRHPTRAPTGTRHRRPHWNMATTIPTRTQPPPSPLEHDHRHPTRAPTGTWHHRPQGNTTTAVPTGTRPPPSPQEHGTAVPTGTRPPLSPGCQADMQGEGGSSSSGELLGRVNPHTLHGPRVRLNPGRSRETGSGHSFWTQPWHRLFGNHGKAKEGEIFSYQTPRLVTGTVA